MMNKLLTNDYFPLPAEQIPFGNFIERIFFDPIGDNTDYPIHGPNVIRLTKGLINFGQGAHPQGLFKTEFKEESIRAFASEYSEIMLALGVDLHNQDVVHEHSKIKNLLSIAALYHDTGKAIRRANHPQIGANLIRNYDQRQQQRFVETLQFAANENPNSKHNRFALITSIIQHHDKFGVVSTGEGGLPIFSDILYFTSDQVSMPGIIKNITSVMLLNLADIAAVNTAVKDVRDNALSTAKEVFNLRVKYKSDYNNKDFRTLESELLKKLYNLCKQNGSCLGLDPVKMNNVLDDWKILVKAIKHEGVLGNRVHLKQHLLSLEKNPSRAIQRVIRLITESAITTNCRDLLNIKYFSPTTVESVLVGTLGAHQFQWFCEQFATVVKLDYGLNFFKAMFCACTRKAIHQNYEVGSNLTWNQLDEYEAALVKKLDDNVKYELARKITLLFVKVLEGLVSRYSGVLNYSSSTPRRFGFQLRDLTLDTQIRNTIIDLLCIQEAKDSIALTWIVDEVTIWSFD